MRLQHIIEAVYSRPWLITATAHAAIQRIVETKLMAGDIFIEREPGQGMCGEQVELEQMMVDDQGIAHVPVSGIIARKLSAFERGAGAVDTMDIGNDLTRAMVDDSVRAILLDIDSPGGIVNGTPELASRIGSLAKPTFAFSAGMMDSAAYWLGSQTDMIFATPSADIGSIGVYAPVLDESHRYAMQGRKVDVVSSGKYKGMGFPGTALTAEQRSLLQSEVNDIAAEFKAAVKSRRPGVSDATLQGQSFNGRSAQANLLVDAVVSDKAEAVAMIINHLES